MNCSKPRDISGVLSVVVSVLGLVAPACSRTGSGGDPKVDGAITPDDHPADAGDGVPIVGVDGAITADDNPADAGDGVPIVGINLVAHGQNSVFVVEKCGRFDLKFHRYLDGQIPAIQDVSPACECGCLCGDTNSPCTPTGTGCDNRADSLADLSSDGILEFSSTLQIGGFLWEAATYTKQQQGDQQCLVRSPLPMGAYRVSVTVYDSHEDAVGRTNGHEVSVDFSITGPKRGVDLVVGACGDPDLATWWEDCRKYATSFSACRWYSATWLGNGPDDPNGICDCWAGDQGCPCTSQQDCLSTCWAPGAGADATACSASQQGVCYGRSTPVGTYCSLNTAGAPVLMHVDTL